MKYWPLSRTIRSDPRGPRNGCVHAGCLLADRFVIVKLFHVVAWLACRDHVVTRDAGERWRACLSHDVSQLSVENVDDLLHAALAEGRQSPNLRTPDADGRGAEREGLEYIGSAPDASVQKYRYAAANSRRNLGKTLQRGSQRFFVAAAVIGDDDAISTVLHTQRSILASHNAFDDELDADDLAQLVEILPADRGGHNIVHLRHVESRIHRRFVECVMGIVDVALSAGSTIRLHRPQQ